MFTISKNFCAKNEVSKHAETWSAIVYAEHVLYLKTLNYPRSNWNKNPTYLKQNSLQTECLRGKLKKNIPERSIIVFCVVKSALPQKVVTHSC